MPGEGIRMSATRIVLLITACLLLSCCTIVKKYHAADFGIKPVKDHNNSPYIQSALARISHDYRKGEKSVLVFEPGNYEFMMDSAVVREYFISNHDQTNPKTIGFNLDSIRHLTIDGNGAKFIFHGRMLPVALNNCHNIDLKNFSIDFENPHISQVKVLENDTINRQITYQPEKWVQYRIDGEKLIVFGDNWEHTPVSGIAFEAKTRRILYNSGDLLAGTKKVTEIAPGIIKADWDNPKLIPGTIISLRGWGRPTPGIFLHKCKDTRIENVSVHYSEGMGLLAQLCENIYADNLRIALKGNDDPRYFTTQADATHFSGCKGKIEVKNGLFENMMDDAINVHGTYLKIQKRLTPHSLTARYMHDQSWGFEWGFPGDTVQFIQAETMETMGKPNTISAIRPMDKPGFEGVREFEIVFTDTLHTSISENGDFGVENLSWTPEVVFANNIIRNNRARGALFSTPRRTVVENNLFDHTSGSAILLCGDCNGWFETGACRDVVIRNNQFVNALTSMYQFTNAVISIYPVIPDLENQKTFFHGNDITGVQILDNYFETFDRPIVYAKSLSFLEFSGNRVTISTDYKPFHWNNKSFFFQKLGTFRFEQNSFSFPFNFEKDVLWEYRLNRPQDKND